MMSSDAERTSLIPNDNDEGKPETEVNITQRNYKSGEQNNSVLVNDLVSNVQMTNSEITENINHGDKNELKSENISNTSRIRFYVTMSIILVIFKGCEEMAGVTLKQFVYSWCKNETVSSEKYNTSNARNSENSTDPCGHVGSKVTESDAQKMASKWELYFNLLSSVLVFFSVSSYGTISDSLGRKPFLCLALLGYTLKCGIIAIIVYYELHIAWILLAYGVDGLCGSNYAVSLYTYACTADVTQRSGSRILAIALMEMVLGVGRFTTQFGNGYFIKRYGFFYPMFTASLSSLLSFLICIITFSETLKLTCKTKRNITCTSVVSRYVSFYITAGNKKDRIIFWLCIVVFILIEFGFQGRSDPIVLYQLGSPFCWSSEEIGWYGAMSTALWYIIGCLLLKPLQFCFSTNTIACLGSLSAISYNVVTGIAPSTLWIFLGMLIILFIYSHTSE